MTTRERLLQKIEMFRRAAGMSRTTFGLACLGDSHFVFELQNGRNPNSETIDRVEAFIDSYPLNGAPEPEAAS